MCEIVVLCFVRHVQCPVERLKTDFIKLCRPTHVRYENFLHEQNDVDELVFMVEENELTVIAPGREIAQAPFLHSNRPAQPPGATLQSGARSIWARCSENKVRRARPTARRAQAADWTMQRFWRSIFQDPRRTRYPTLLLFVSNRDLQEI